MHSVYQFFTRLFERFDRIEKSLAQRWHLHSNRRTIIILIILGACCAYGYLNFIRAPEHFPTKQLITIPSGETTLEIGETLQEAGIVRSAFAFYAMTYLTGHVHDLRAGDYIFKSPMNVYEIARTIAIGAYGLEPIKITIIDGTTTAKMATMFSQNLPHFNTAQFLRDSAPLEGYLYPDTYYFLPNATEETVIQAMRQNFDEHEATIDQQVQSFGHPLRDDVIMASIIEVEAQNMQDRQMIAGVLWNRIAKGIPLQADPTITFATGKTDSELTIADLTSTSSYNTYNHKGLPPGPINSPSIAALLAAVTPIKSNYLFYLADNQGVTHYAVTYAQQLANERKYLGH